MIDWDAPLEAVHVDGRVVPMALEGGDWPDRHGDYKTTDSPAPQSNEWWTAGGIDRVNGSGWSIRNAVEQPAWRTSAEQLDRMNALVERLAALDAMGRSGAGEIKAEARAILAAREPVDPRFDKVLNVLQQNKRWLMPEDAARRFVRDVLAALDA